MWSTKITKGFDICQYKSSDKMQQVKSKPDSKIMWGKKNTQYDEGKSLYVFSPEAYQCCQSQQWHTEK